MLNLVALWQRVAEILATWEGIPPLDAQVAHFQAADSDSYSHTVQLQKGASYMESNSDQPDIRVGDEVFDDTGINGWGIVTRLMDSEIEAEWHATGQHGRGEKRWTSRRGIRRIYRRQQAS